MIPAAILSAWLVMTPGWVAEEVSRLAGHKVQVVDDGYRIVSIAGEGPPLVGKVVRDGDALFLVADDGPRLMLAGPLATPRIAGPGYKVWALGDIAGTVLTVERIGILAPP